jgi:hypothetical protein
MNMPALGPAQRPDGSLKDAHEMEWSHSRSPSPVPLSTPIGKITMSKKNAKVMATAGKKNLTRKPHAVKQKQQTLHPSRPNSGVISAKKDKVKQRVNLTLNDKVEIVDFLESEDSAGMSQAEIAKHLQKKFPKLQQFSISRIKGQAAAIRERAKDLTQLTYKRPRKVQYPALESALSLWVVEMESRGVKLSGDLICGQARRFAQMLGVDDNNFLKLSNGWLDSFKARHLLKSYRFHGEAASVSEAGVQAARKRLQEITSHYALRDVFNMDETALFYRMPPNRGLATKQISGLKGDKTRLSLAFTANADGSEKRKVLIIGHARKPHCFKKKEGSALGFDYYWNSKAWMVGSIFQRCVINFFCLMQKN